MIENFLNLIAESEPFQQFILLGFGILFAFRILFEFLFSFRILFLRKNIVNDSGNPVSLFLTIRNEEENIANNLPAILNINNVDYEVIVIDDFSQDNSLTVLGTMKNVNQKLRISGLNQETRFSVKLAQNIAIKATKNEWIMEIPVSISEFGENWLQNISQLINEDKRVIINYSNILPTKGFYNYLYRLECFFQQVKSVGYIINGLSFVYFEDNIAFKKEEYFKMGGFGKKINEPYTNLELLINKFISKKTTQISYNSSTIIRKKEEINGVDYFDFLKKSFRIEKNLSFFKRLVLHFDTFLKLLYIPVSIAVIILFTDVWLLVVVLLGLHMLLHLFIIKILQNRLNERKIFIPSLLYDLFMPYFKTIYRWQFNRRSRKQKWRSSI